jgi:hypothetical protein
MSRAVALDVLRHGVIGRPLARAGAALTRFEPVKRLR